MKQSYMQEGKLSDGSKVYSVIFRDDVCGETLGVGFECDSYDSAASLAAMLEVHTVATFNA